MADKHPSSESKWGLSSAERENLLQGLRYIGSIVLTVIITFIVVALVSRSLGI